jgi:DNA-binding MarR family transcriptional regulator
MANPKSPKPKPTPKRRRPALIVNNPVEDVVVSVARLGMTLVSIIDKFFEGYGITLLQFNILRVLYVRDPDCQGLPSGSFAARMISFSPDMPRMMDRLVKAELIERGPSPTDRRVVLVKLTQKGVDRMEDVWPFLLEHNRKLFGDMSQSDLAKLAELASRATALVVANRPGAAS